MEVYYVDIPGLSAFAEKYGYCIKVFSHSETERNSFTLPLIDFLSYYQNAIALVQPHVSSIPDLSIPNHRLLGATFSFDDRFRTKNAPFPTKTRPKPRFSDGPWAKTPHIYRKLGEWTLAIRFDPKWITGPGAYGKFRPTAGHRRFTRLCTISALHFGGKRISAIPLVIGQHVSHFNELLISRRLS